MTAEPRVALTFDDGPHPKNTETLITILSERLIPATFFVLGQRMQRRPEIVRHIHEAGHEIGNHGWSHTAFTVLKDEAIIRELKKTTDLIQKVSSQECAIYRPPYGAITEDQQLLIAGQLSYRLVLWNVDSLDWQRPRAEQLILNATTLRAEKSIVLFHDFSDMTRDTLPRILDILLGCNCTFYTASRIVADLEG